MIIEILAENGLEPQNEGRANLLYLSKDKASQWQTKIPPSLKLKPLKLSHANIVNDHWGGKSDISIKLVENLIKFNPSLGLFDENDQLIGWILR